MRWQSNKPSNGHSTRTIWSGWMVNPDVPSIMVALWNGAKHVKQLYPFLMKRLRRQTLDHFARFVHLHGNEFCFDMIVTFSLLGLQSHMGKIYTHIHTWSVHMQHTHTRGKYVGMLAHLNRMTIIIMRDVQIHGDVLHAMALFAMLCLGVQCVCLLYTSPSPRDMRRTRMPSSA